MSKKLSEPQYKILRELVFGSKKADQFSRKSLNVLKERQLLRYLPVRTGDVVDYYAQLTDAGYKALLLEMVKREPDITAAIFRDGAMFKAD